jgi:NAD(P)-dependent dehydrogenase (short-subunit alcohol dehydrogenase family)
VAPEFFNRPLIVGKRDLRQFVITGVSRGLGRALTEELIRRGHVVHGCARSADRVDELRRTFPKPHSFEVVDVASDDQVRRWAERVLAADVVPDLLINNAAIINPSAPLVEVSAADFSAVVDVNVKGTVNVIRHFLPAMIARGQGVVVNLSSGWGRSTSPEVAPYCATKWAIEGLTQALAQELPPGLAAVALNPGIIDTEMLRSCFGPDAASYPDAASWARRAAPFLLKLGPSDNGQPLSVPD